MKNDMSLPVPSQSGDGWGAVPSTGSNTIRGRIVKFTTLSEFLCGDDVLNGREFAAAGVLTHWTKWVDGKPVAVLETLAGAHPPAPRDARR